MYTVLYVYLQAASPQQQSLICMWVSGAVLTAADNTPKDSQWPMFFSRVEFKSCWDTKFQTRALLGNQNMSSQNSPRLAWWTSQYSLFCLLFMFGCWLDSRDFDPYTYGVPTHMVCSIAMIFSPVRPSPKGPLCCGCEVNGHQNCHRVCQTLSQPNHHSDDIKFGTTIHDHTWCFFLARFSCIILYVHFLLIECCLTLYLSLSVFPKLGYPKTNDFSSKTMTNFRW